MVADSHATALTGIGLLVSSLLPPPPGLGNPRKKANPCPKPMEWKIAWSQPGSSSLLAESKGRA